MIVNGIDYPIETPTYVLNENFRNFAPEGLTTVAVSGDEYTSAIILKTPRYYKNLDLSEYTARAYYYTHWLDDEQKSSEGSIPLYNYEVQENNIIYVWQLDINQTYKKGRVDFGLSWSNDDWKLNTKGCYFVVQRFVNTEGSYIAPDIAEQLQAEIDTLFAMKQDKQDESLETEDKTIVGAINELNDFRNRSEGFATEEQGEKADIALLQKSGFDLDDEIEVVEDAIYQCTETVDAKNTTIRYNEEYETLFVEGYFYQYKGNSTYYLVDVQKLPSFPNTPLIVTSEWLNSTDPKDVDTNKIYQCKNTSYGFIEGHFYRVNYQTLEWEQLDVQDLSNYYNKSETNTLLNGKQDKFANVEETGGGDYTLEPQSTGAEIMLSGRFRFTPDPDADTNNKDIVNRDILESYHDNTKADTTYVDNADNNLQEQIDAIASSSDVVDVVGTYAELQAYDTTHLKDNDIVKVLEDSTHNNAITYYRWDIDTQTWSYVGQSGPYYTKSETDSLLQSKADANNVYTKTQMDDLLEDKATKTQLENHILDENNPHNVTKTQVGLGNVDNTSDLNKPISNATRTALDDKVNQVAAFWLNNNSGEWDNIYQCLDTGYGFTEGYFYVKKMNPQTAEIYWERIDVQPQTDLSDYYNKTETDALLDTKQSLTSSVGKKTPELGEIFNLIEGKFIVNPKTAYPAVGYMSPTSILVSGQSYTFTCKFTTTNNNFDFSTDSTDLRNMFGFWGANSTNTSNAFWWRMTSHTISYDSNTQIVTAKFTASDDSQGISLGGYAKIVMGDGNANFRGTGTYYFSEPSFVNDATPTINILANCPIDNQHYVTTGSDTTLAHYKGKWVSYDDSANPEIPTLVGGSVCKAGYLSHAEGDGTWATARMSHSEGRGNNFELWIDDDFEYSYNRIYIMENQDWLAQTIRKNAVIAVPIKNDKYNFYYTIDRSKYDNDRGVYYIEVDRNVQGAVFDKPMLVMMGGSTSSWAHTEGNFTNAVDLTATDLEDTEDNKTRQHAEGSRTLATGYAAHAEGEYTQALANHSHAGGEGTIADQVGETAIGRYNDPQSDDLFEIGNGDDNSRSNAFRVTQTGKVIGGAQTESTDDGLTLTTKTYTDNKLAVKADIDGSYVEMSVGNAENLISDTKIEEKVPYNYRSAGGNKRVGNYLQEEIVGGTVVFNQLCDKSKFSTDITYNGVTRISNTEHGVISISGSNTAGNTWRGIQPFANTATDLIQIGHRYVIIIDEINGSFANSLKLYMNFGTRVWQINKDGIYEAVGANSVPIANFRFEVGADFSVPSDNPIVIRPQIFDLTQMFGSTIADYIYSLETASTGAGVSYFKSLFPNDYYEYNAGTLMSVKTSAHKIYNNNGDLVVSYPLDSDLELRGIPKLDSNNNLYYDGDVYESDGTVTRKYGIRAYGSGDENLTDVITDKTNTIYPLGTPTTEQATPYANPQYIDNNGYEEYTDTRAVAIPVGHNSQYSQDLRGKIENAPDNPQNDGDYIVRQTSGVNEYIRLDTLFVTLTQTQYDNLQTIDPNTYYYIIEE